jgi:gamma-glutamylcyclotransferase (GGCT)/AIG2-like uncharacterized protein YtfP
MRETLDAPRVEPESPADVFAYGTLAYPHMVRAVTGREFESEPATLPRYEAFLVEGRCYPAAVERRRSRLRGRLYRGVDEVALARLDRFEGSEYERRRVQVETDEGCRVECSAWMLVAHLQARVSATRWCPDTFEREHMREWLDACRGR